MKVLIVDDDKDVAESTVDALQIMGVEAVMCTDAQHILDTMRAERPDAVLQDVRMPGLDLEVTLRAMADDPALSDIPRLLFTANRATVEHLRGDLVHDIVQKPFDLDDLVARLKALAGD